jgi:hypothetical protein
MVGGAVLRGIATSAVTSARQIGQTVARQIGRTQFPGPRPWSGWSGWPGWKQHIGRVPVVSARFRQSPLKLESTLTTLTTLTKPVVTWVCPVRVERRRPDLVRAAGATDVNNGPPAQSGGPLVRGAGRCGQGRAALP